MDGGWVCLEIAGIITWQGGTLRRRVCGDNHYIHITFEIVANFVSLIGGWM